MNKYVNAMSYLIAVNFEALILILVAWKGGVWLNANHPIGIDWMIITILLAIVSIAYIFWKMILYFMKL